MIKFIIIGMAISVSLTFRFFFWPLKSGQWQFKQSASPWPNMTKRGVFAPVMSLFMVGFFMMNSGSVLAADSTVTRGKNIFAKLSCSICHRIHGEGAQVGPDLSYEGDKRDRKWLLAHFKDPKSVVPNSIMPPVSISDSELGDLSSYMLSLKKEIN